MPWEYPPQRPPCPHRPPKIKHENVNNLPKIFKSTKIWIKKTANSYSSKKDVRRRIHPFREISSKQTGISLFFFFLWGPF